MERDPVRVRNDVARKLMSVEKAREAYGVILAGNVMELDLRATEDLRASMRTTGKPSDLFDFGEGRAAGLRSVS